jgi:hypothetical protein
MPRCLSQHLHRGQVGPIPRSLAADSHVASADALSRRSVSGPAIHCLQLAGTANATSRFALRANDAPCPPRIAISPGAIPRYVAGAGIKSRRRA